MHHTFTIIIAKTTYWVLNNYNIHTYMMPAVYQNPEAIVT